jgi:hypothetical protein
MSSGVLSFFLGTVLPLSKKGIIKTNRVQDFLGFCCNPGVSKIRIQRSFKFEKKVLNFKEHCVYIFQILRQNSEKFNKKTIDPAKMEW